MIPPCKGMSWLLLLWEVDAGAPTLTCIAVFPADLKPSTMNCSNVGSLVRVSDSFGFAWKRVEESWNNYSWERPPRSFSSTINPSPISYELTLYECSLSAQFGLHCKGFRNGRAMVIGLWIFLLMGQLPMFAVSKAGDSHWRKSFDTYLEIVVCICEIWTLRIQRSPGPCVTDPVN